MTNFIKPITIWFKKLHENAILPCKSTEFAGCWDVVATRIKQVSDNFVICYLGWAAEIPTGYELVLVPRSSFTKYNWVLQNSPGQGDPDYKGEYQFRFRAMPSGIRASMSKDAYHIVPYELSYDEFPYKEGERLGQVYLRQIIEIEPEWTKKLSNSTRGDGGFGSTGN